MDRSLTVRFDGRVFHPQSPIDLPPDTEYEITIRPKVAHDKTGSLWELLGELAGTVEAPEDWSEQHDRYIHGTPRRAGEPE